MEDTYKYANNNIKLLLKFKGWTREYLCKKTGISMITLTRRLNGNGANWKLEESLSISKTFKMPVKDVFFTQLIPNGNTEQNNVEKGA